MECNDVLGNPMKQALKEYLEETLAYLIEEEKYSKEFLEDMYDPNCYGTGYNVGQMALIREILDNFDLVEDKNEE